MRRIAPLLLALCFAGLGSGAVSWLHDAQHAREDAAVVAAAAKAGLPVPTTPVHDESNCHVHAQLHVPLAFVGYVPLLTCLGLLVTFLTQLTPVVVSRRPMLCIDCRGPPAC